ncbi:hypothetical protein Fleli_0908 [Bernardetia litoralis DSM 6794]|uniref:Uncharacterized protein n=1 Tax=Bernardetia litoralis (strain ATCC 23117 / DSM 6794 / NBRC 15988 / NCIMB 1366 / Fx l1 / Sio-4) TaxID=880071 RepID=I4AHC8_BERLS|nr:hypothetical protein [Bernardetia litoralis]AFM03363.1 hypothetical protein Fleli_0908 [Bernardetia litoralis DSM 6794]
MDSLKKKFGKFAVSSEKMAKVNGGLSCSANGGATKMEFLDANEALKWCARRPSCTGCH